MAANKRGDDISRDLDPSCRRWEKVWNSQIGLPLPWKWRIAPHKYWEARKVEDKHGAIEYADMGPTADVLVNEVAAVALDLKAPILDVCCNVGRHMNALWNMGYRNLYGCDIQIAAVDHMGKLFTEMKAGSHVTQGSLQSYLPTVGDRYFDVVFSHGATIELIPPTFNVCRELARVADRAIVLVINENGHSYPRLWESDFLKAGFLLTKLERPILPNNPNSLMVFRRISKSIE